jgi:hypothetical protein
MIDFDSLIVDLSIARNGLEAYAPTDCVYITKLNKIIEELKKEKGDC